MSDKKKTSFSEFTQQVREEASKITWPTKQATMSATILIIIISILTAIFFFVVDQSIMGVIRAIFGLVE
ncbi:MAG: preprotein translocase subunit SecE [Alphaproteobacteria bacterium]|nr:preprotein translocase subunit SecE [Alphaproteobacteria bacterium]MBN2779995.1 preprotein translocase subunit SecE [Alphaproteobacteria bacterium]